MDKGRRPGAGGRDGSSRARVLDLRLDPALRGLEFPDHGVEALAADNEEPRDEERVRLLPRLLELLPRTFPQNVVPARGKRFATEK